MRFWSCAAVIAVTASCSGKSTSSTPSYTRFLPAEADTAFRADMTALRAWSGFSELSPIALGSVEMLLADAKSRCGLDVIGSATKIIAAKNGGLMAGDLTLIVEGLPRDQVLGCVAKVAEAKSMLAMQVDGNLFHANVAERSLASGAVLPGGEVVLVSRGGGGVAPADWKTEVERGAPSAPAWWREIAVNSDAPVVVRTSDSMRVVVATARLNNGIAIKGMVTNKTPEGGESDAKLLSAMLDYLEKAKAGTGKVVANGAVVNVELAASGAEMSTLIKTGGAALFPRGTNVGAKVTAGPVDCQMLADAVQQYMQEALAASAEDKKQENADMVARVLPPLQKAYVASCEADKWTADVISCHVDNAKNLPRFERCRMLLPDGPRAAFDTAVGLVLDKEMTPPAAGTGAGSAGAGSGT